MDAWMRRWVEFSSLYKMIFVAGEAPSPHPSLLHVGHLVELVYSQPHAIESVNRRGNTGRWYRLYSAALPWLKARLSSVLVSKAEGDFTLSKHDRFEGMQHREIWDVAPSQTFHCPCSLNAPLFSVQTLLSHPCTMQAVWKWWCAQSYFLQSVTSSLITLAEIPPSFVNKRSRPVALLTVTTPNTHIPVHTCTLICFDGLKSENCTQVHFFLTLSLCSTVSRYFLDLFQTFKFSLLHSVVDLWPSCISELMYKSWNGMERWY